MASDNDNPMTSEQQPSTGPGPALRAQREAGGHSLDDVAKHTRISRSKLAALESEDYAKVGSDTFVMGYIRQYAKWLGINADELVKDYERISGREPRETEEVAADSRSTSSSSAASGARKALPLVWLVVGIAVLGVLLTWFMNSQEQAERPRTETPQPAAEREPAVPEVDAVSPDSTYDTPQDPFVVDDDVSVGQVDTAPAAEIPAAVEVIDESLLGAESADAVRETEEAPASDAAPTPEPAATDELTMTFSGDCWVEVRNAEGEVLFAQLQHAGDNLQLSGQAPFSLMLGNARAATVYVNGQLVDTNPGPNRDTMRLRVGP